MSRATPNLNPGVARRWQIVPQGHSLPQVSSTTPVPAASAALSLTERRKAETRMEIARAAAGLFVRQGLRATRAEDIAQAAGVAPRTFYRYFASKEEAVAPLYAAGAELWAAAVRAAPEDLSVPEALEQAVRHTLTPGAGVSSASWTFVRTLIRLARSSPALRKVWAEVCHASEVKLLEALAERSGLREDAAPGDADNVSAVSPELRFAAVVASAAVRVAMETWATGDGPAAGPEGPAELALRNLRALRDFPWEAATKPRG
jgi:AcrR family transcriptional regulator